MIDFSEDQYRDLCRDGRVQLEIETIEDKRRGGLRRFWLFVLAGAVAGALIGWTLTAAGLTGFGPFAGWATVLGAFVLALRQLNRVGRDLKIPLLERLASQGGMTYAADGFEPPVYAEARPMLFGTWLSDEGFTDLFAGTDADGRRYAVYEAVLKRSSGKSRHVVFTGQVYAFERRARSGGPVIAVPDRGLFNFLAGYKGLERVPIDSDPEFEKTFQVYAAHPHEALLLLDGDARRALLEWRRGGRVFAYVGPKDILLAIAGPNRFEPGSMFRARSGEARARAMFDDVRASLAVLRSLKASLD